MGGVGARRTPGITANAVIFGFQWRSRTTEREKAAWLGAVWLVRLAINERAVASPQMALAIVGRQPSPLMLTSMASDPAVWNQHRLLPAYAVYLFQSELGLALGSDMG